MSKVEKFPLLTREYLHRRYVLDAASCEEIAAEVGCSVANVKKRIKDWKVYRRGLVKRKSWNEGLTKHTDERLAKIARERMGGANPMAGRSAWNKGLSPEDDPRVDRIVQAMRSGFDTPETREKMAAAKRGLVGPKSNRYLGSFCNRQGYRFGNGGYEHRALAEIILGRALLPSEHVHHMDRNRKNNDPSNLLVLDVQAHLKLHVEMRKNNELDQCAWLSSQGYQFWRLNENQVRHPA